MLFQRKFGNCLAVLIHDGHAPVREIRSIHKHAIRPELAGDFPRAFAGGLHIREVELVSGRVFVLSENSTLYFGMIHIQYSQADGAVLVNPFTKPV